MLKVARQIKRVFGKVYVDFGEPLVLADFLESQRPGWQDDSDDATGAGDSAAQGSAGTGRAAQAHAAASELAQRLNAAAVINPINLLALCLLATRKHTADEQALHRLIEHYQALSTDAPYSPSIIPCALDAHQVVAYAQRLHIVERVAHPLGDLIRVPEGEAPLLAYFRNNVLPVFALPALIACLLNNNRYLDAQRVSEVVGAIYGLLGSELFLRWTPDELPAATQAVIDVFVARALIRRNESGRLSAPEPNSQEFAELRLLGETLRPILERHFLALALLQHVGSGRRTRRALEDDCHLLAQRLALLRLQHRRVLGEDDFRGADRQPHRRRPAARGRNGSVAFRQAHHDAARAGAGVAGRSTPGDPAHGQRP